MVVLAYTMWSVLALRGQVCSVVIPCLSKVGPVGHDHGTEHHVVLGEVAGKEFCWSNHRQAKHIRDLISMCCVCPWWYLMSSRWITSDPYYYIHVTDTAQWKGLFFAADTQWILQRARTHTHTHTHTHTVRHIKEAGKQHFLGGKRGNEISF